MYRGSKKKMQRRVPKLVMAGALAAGGVVAAVGAAGAATHAAHTAHSAAADGQRPGDGLHAGGRVTAVSGTSLSVQSPTGTTTTYTLTSSTKVTKDGVAATLSDLAVGERVHVELASATSLSAVAVDIATPHVMGQVVSVAGNVITIANPDGLQTTVDVTGSTTYTKGGTSASLSDVTAGSFIAASGTVASDHTTFDASNVMVGLPSWPEGAGPMGDGPHGPGSTGDGPEGPGPMGGGPGGAF
ncbi:MAG: hypothetical protein KGJ42_02530 [Acidobacteriota bacterium]|nr:hypothetical protein [Acidobacteriota bacterium]